MTNRVFIDECIRSLNDYRRSHQASPLTHNSAMSTIAQGWADQLARTGSLGHNPNASYKGQPLGENCAFKWYSDRRDVSGQEIVAQWYSEVKDYDFKRHSGTNTGHFTQVVWKGSREVGIGRSQSRDGKWFVVANFFPAGNYVGQYSSNVLPPRDGKVVLPASNEARSQPQGGRLKTSNRGMANLQTSGHVTPTIGTPGFIQRRTQIQTVNGVTTTSFVTEVRRDLDGTVTTTTTNTCNHDNQLNPGPPKKLMREVREEPDGTVTTTMRETTSPVDEPLPGRLARVSIAETRGAYMTSSARNVQFSAPDTGLKPSQAQFDQRPRQMTISMPTSHLTDEEFASRVVHQHNTYRRQHGNVGDLMLSRELSKLAERWAEHLARTNTFQHSHTTYLNQPLGENIAFNTSSSNAAYPEAAVREWYNQISVVDFTKIEDAVIGAAHFTQVVWRGSREIGVGRAFANGGQRVYVVCNYYPAGNIRGYFKHNVFPQNK